VAIGAYGNNDNGNNAGQTQVYQNIAGTWIQLGQNINGEAAYDKSGWSVSISSDGSIVAIGSPYGELINTSEGLVRVYQNLSGTWTQIGQAINGTFMGENFGTSISLSVDGSIVAIGSQLYNSSTGQVKIYQNLSGTWTQIGQDINGETSSDFLGKSVSLSSDGSIVAIGATGSSSGKGQTKIYQNLSGIWTQIGQSIYGEASGDNSGWSVSLTADGSIVAIGATRNAGNGTNSGHVRVYQNLSGIWTQIRQDIDGEAADDNSGCSVSISADGSIVAIGANNNDGNGDGSGQTRIYGHCETFNAINASACETYTVPSGDETHTTSGVYNDTILNTAGCDSIITINLTINHPVSILTQPTGKDICLGNSVTFSIDSVGTSPSFQWKKTGVNITGETNSSYTISSVSLSDEGIYSCQINNMCNSLTTDPAELTIIELSTDAGTADNICLGNSAEIQATATSNHIAESGIITYSWSPTTNLDNANISNPNASPDETTIYSLVIEDEIGCTATSSVEVFVQNALVAPEICIVTLDLQTEKNLIVWECPNISDIDSFVVYREEAGVFEEIARQHADSLTEYVDTSSHPDQIAYSYKISLIDTCGNESPMSDYHRTVNLSHTGTGPIVLIWNDYLKEDGTYPTNYEIYRGTDLGNMSLYQTQTPGYGSYNVNVPSPVSGEIYYVIATGSDCMPTSPSKTTGGPYSHSLSNLDDYGTGTSITNFEQNGIQIYPNPSTGVFTVQGKNITKITITDLNGKTILVIKDITEFNNIDLSKQAKGIYMVKILKNDNIIMEKVVIE